MKKLLLSSMIVLLSAAGVKAEEASSRATGDQPKSSDPSVLSESSEIAASDENLVNDEEIGSTESATDEGMTTMVQPRRGGYRGGYYGGGSYRGGYRGGGMYRRSYDRGGYWGGRGYYGGYRTRPGWYSGWRWNRYSRPSWWYRGITFPRYYRYRSIPYNYYQCTAFDQYMNAYSAGGRTVNEAAYNALYSCGGNAYNYSGCYIPEGYCQFR